MLVPLGTSGSPVDIKSFWSAIYVYNERPHLVNRKLAGSSIVYNYKIEFNEINNKLEDLINYTSVSYEAKKLEEPNKETLKTFVSDLLLPYDKNLEIEEVDYECSKSQDGIFVGVKVLFPSSLQCKNTVEIAVFHKSKSYALFVSASDNEKVLLVAPPFPYKFSMRSSGELELIIDIENADSPSAEWLIDKLFCKILKWIEDAKDNLEFQQSLSLVSIENYCFLYRKLKEKHGKRLVEIWPENTDPLKFVYEDIAIATYLICLWNQSGKPDEKPKFVDLGCGNGLLVYILNEEGYQGFGIDVRKRKIWDLYPHNTDLRVETITPSDSNLFPECDWIIGNHSDELTPWIPVIAARSSSRTNFFLLPCCAYEFSGAKYIRKNTKQSVYSEYLQYVANICDCCGFETKIDKLRIPSTKRTCLVSFGRKYEIDLVGIDKLIDSNGSRTGEGNMWINDFKARNVRESVRNCTQIDKALKDRIIMRIVGLLLLCVEGDSNCILKKYDQTPWNAGKRKSIVDLVDGIDKNDLKMLKSECKGIQTLMKNHRYIFEIAEGFVKLRVPPLLSETTKYKDKSCWFRQNHPQQCLNADDLCAYSHI